LLWFRRDARSGNFGIDVCFKEEAVASCDDEVFIVGAVVVTLNPAVDIRFHHAVFRLKGWAIHQPKLKTGKPHEGCDENKRNVHLHAHSGVCGTVGLGTVLDSDLTDDDSLIL
jgi:hypothetical protein